MKKKTYKQMQNRLYREIKRRIEAEKRIMIPMEVRTDGRQIDTIAVRNMVPCRVCTKDKIVFVKSIMANKIATKLLADQYITFCSYENHYAPAIDTIEIEARLDVVKPKEVFYATEKDSSKDYAIKD